MSAEALGMEEGTGLQDGQVQQDRPAYGRAQAPGDFQRREGSNDGNIGVVEEEQAESLQPDRGA